nr:AMP-binding protein [Leptolyngbyaceae cyanobacterium MAG.088]
MTVAAFPRQPTNNLATESNLTTAQHLLWLGQKLAPDSPLYNMAFLFTLSGKIQSDHFQSAFQALVERSDTLRMVIQDVNGEPQRQVLPQLDYKVPILDFSDRENPPAEVRNWAANRSQILFDLSEKLFDTALIRLGADRYAWYLNQHHLITDIQSVKLIYQTVGDFYQRSVAGSLSEAPMLPAYGDISLPSPSARTVDYWQQQQANSVELYHRSAHQISSRTRRVSCELGPDKTAALKQLAMNSEAQALTPQLSLFNLVSGILLAYLYRISGSEQVAFATPAHGRPTALLKETIGVFIELFPLQADIEPGETFASLLRKVSHASGGMLRYAQPGASQFAPSRDANVVLNFIHAKLPDFAGFPVRSDWIHPGAGDPQHHLRLQVHDFDNRGSLQLHFDVNCDLFEPKLQERATEHFLALVDAVLADLNQPIADVEIVNGSEQSHLMELAKCESIGINKTVVQQFEEQVKRTPAAIAITCENETLTYERLNARANRLAHYLRAQGVTTEIPVGICLRRSIDMLVAIWGILKAGGAYVPIDPSHPHERIGHILEDTQVGWVVTHSGLTPHLNAQVINIQLDSLDLTPQPTNNLNHPSATNHLAYLLYTSGSTGKPKGVEIEHRGLANYVNWAIQQYVRGRTLSFPLFSPFTFDLTVTSIYVP